MRDFQPAIRSWSLQVGSMATAHAAQLSLRGHNSERIEQTVLGSKNEELFLRS